MVSTDITSQSSKPSQTSAQNGLPIITVNVHTHASLEPGTTRLSKHPSTWYNKKIAPTQANTQLAPRASIYISKPTKDERHSAQTQSKTAEQPSHLTTQRHIERDTANKKHRQKNILHNISQGVLRRPSHACTYHVLSSSCWPMCQIKWCQPPGWHAPTDECGEWDCVVFACDLLFVGLSPFSKRSDALL
jgi:hypothetical protein